MNLESAYLQLYQAASQVSTLQELIETAHRLSGYSIAAADSIHEIIGVSQDIAAQFGPSVDWNTLVKQHFLPTPPDSEAQRYQMPFPLQIQQSPPIHTSRCALPDGGLTFMCDLRNQGHIVLKLAVMRTSDSDQAAAFVQVLAECCYMLYFRLCSIGAYTLSGRGQYLHGLIHRTPQNTQVDVQWLNVRPPYVLLVFPEAARGVVALSFSDMSTALERTVGYGIRTVTDTEQLAVLLHGGQDPQVFFDTLDRLLQQFGQPAGLSSPFSDLNRTADAYQEAARALQTALDFANFSRLAGQEEFTVFQIFYLVAEGDNAERLLHSDAKKLEQMDIEHSCHYMETVFSWLYYEKNAARAARHVFIHRNTLDNRIRKITSLLDARWEQGGYCVRMLYSTWFLLRKHGWLRDCLLYLPESD